MEKQTATEWLFDKLWDEPRDKFNWFVLLKQAEKMEKEQIIDAYADGDKYDILLKQLGEEYYNKTYKKD